MRYIYLLLVFLLLTSTSSLKAQCVANLSTSINNLTVNFTNLSTTPPGAVMRYHWWFGDGNSSTQENPTHTYNQGGTYLGYLSVFDSSNTCFDSTAFYITVTAPCLSHLNFIYENIGTNQVQFQSQVGTNPLYKLVWDFGDGNVDSSNAYNIVHNYASSGLYIVSLTLYDSANNCMNRDRDTIQASICEAGFNVNVYEDTAFITNTVPPSNYTNMYYTFGDSTSSSAIDPVHIYSSSGTYTITQTVWNNNTLCSKTISQTVTINIPQCQAAFSGTINQATVSILNQASHSNFIQYDFGDGSTSNLENPSHTYSQSGSYLICQYVADTNRGCTDVFCDTFKVNVPPVCQAAFSAAPSNDSLFIQDSAIAYTRVLYTFGDGDSSTLSNPTHVYSQSGTYVVCQTVWNDSTNCTDTYCDTVSIIRPPDCEAGFTYTQIVDTVFFSSTAISSNRVKYFFGDGDSSNLLNPTHEYLHSGVYIVRQEVFNDARNCSDTYLDTLTVNVSTSCFADFQIAIDTNKRSTLYLVNVSSKVNSHQYNWDFGDGGQASGRTPIHHYQNRGKYQVCLTISDQSLGCWSQKCDSLGLDSMGNILKSNGFTLRVLDGSFIGIEEEEKSIGDHLNLFPNPFSSNLNIELELDHEPLNYEIYSLSGSIILKGIISQNNTLLTLDKLKRGTYLFRLFNEKESVYKKLIKH